MHFPRRLHIPWCIDDVYKLFWRIVKCIVSTLHLSDSVFFFCCSVVPGLLPSILSEFPQISLGRLRKRFGPRLRLPKWFIVSTTRRSLTSPMTHPGALFFKQNPLHYRTACCHMSPSCHGYCSGTRAVFSCPDLNLFGIISLHLGLV